MRSARRWGARLALVVLVGLALFGLWLIPLGRSASRHIWPVYSHHFLPVFAMLIVWVIVGLAVVCLIGALVFWLWDEATT